jgi:hypothetical protein
MFWAEYEFEETAAKAGVARGYLRVIEGLKGLLSLPTIRIGSGQLAPRGSLVLHVTPPHLFKPVYGARNVLFSMWEAESLPDDIVAHVRRADAHIVPSLFCKHGWSRAKLQADVVPLGLPEAYMDLPARCIPDKPKRFLWVGSAIPRKGWNLIAPAWQRLFPGGDRNGWKDAPQLYVKTIGDGTVKEPAGGQITLDQRDLDDVGMLELYQSADVYFSTSFGEGFGLPALEAMAAGCLVVSPEAGGDFLTKETAIIVHRSVRTLVSYGGRFAASLPSPQDVAEALQIAMLYWGSFRNERVRLAGQAAARAHSWRASAVQLMEVLNRLVMDAQPAGVASPERVSIFSTSLEVAKVQRQATP